MNALETLAKVNKELHFFLVSESTEFQSNHDIRHVEGRHIEIYHHFHHHSLKQKFSKLRFSVTAVNVVDVVTVVVVIVTEIQRLVPDFLQRRT